MKHQLLRYQSTCRPGGSILALVIVFFFLPYFIDVAYYADQTPTHDAQESPKVGAKAEASYEKIPLAVADVQNDSIYENDLPSLDGYKRIGHPTWGTSSSQRLFHVLVISRPPPGA